MALCILVQELLQLIPEILVAVVVHECAVEIAVIALPDTGNSATEIADLI